MKVALSFFIICIFFAMPVCAENLHLSNNVDITLEPVLSRDWVCYLKDGDLYAKNMQGVPVRIVSGKEKGCSVTNPKIIVIKQSIFISWVERVMDKYKIMFASIKQDKKALSRQHKEISQGTGNIQTRFVRDQKGRFYLFSIISEKSPEISIYTSSDNGDSFLEKRAHVDEMDAFLNMSPLVVDDSLHLFVAFKKQDKTYLSVKTYDLPSLERKDTTILKESDGFIFLEPLSVKGRPMILYKTVRNNRYALEGFVRNDKRWDMVIIEEAQDIDVARLDSHVWENGRIIVVYSGSRKKDFKQRVYAATSDDMAKTWNVRRIDSKVFDNTRSWLPRLAVRGEHVAVVWEDSRSIRPVIWMNLSSDKGKTWLKNDYPLSDDSKNSIRPRISQKDGTFYIAWHQFQSDERKHADLVMKHMKWEDLRRKVTSKKEAVTTKAKENMLKERTDLYWKSMIKNDLNTSYHIHDPFYRAKITFDYYSAHRGPMVYHSYQLDDYIIQGNIARVSLTIKYEVPKFTILGKESSIPLTEVAADDVYIFLDGTWYRKFIDALSGGSAIDY